ncbi:MAG: phosphocholine cytidylyltransferase family protein [Polyangiaceae bacterium]
MMSTTTAVILVAGIGSRLRPLTDDRPKALVEVHGRSILARAVDALVAHGVGHVVLATGYRQDAIARQMETCRARVTLCHNPRFDTTQNVVSLALCRDAVAGEGFFKLDGDVLFQSDVLRRLDASAADLAVAVDERRALDEEAMKVEARAGRIVAFGKALPLEGAAGESIGIERVSGSVCERLFDAIDATVSAGHTDVYYEHVYDQLVRDGLVADAVAVGDLPWTEVDDPADLSRAAEMFD